MVRGRFDVERMYLDKWQMHLAMTDAQISELNIPQAQLLVSLAGSSFSQHKSWYIKPIYTWGGHSITRISSTGDRWTMKDSKGLETTFQNTNQLLWALKSTYPPEATIAQVHAPVALYKRRPFDIRTLYQRDHDEKWIFAGWLARVGSEKSIVSNIGTGHGEVIPTKRVLSQLYQNKQQLHRVTQRIKRLGSEICHVLDSYHTFDEVGIDFGLDKHGGVWLFEVNTNDRLGGPSHELFRHLPNQVVYEAIEKRYMARRDREFRSLVRDLSNYAKNTAHPDGGGIR